MDRLERALQKARELRRGGDAESGKTLAPSAKVAPPTEAAQDAPRPMQSAAVHIPDSTLEQNRIVARLTRSASADVFRILRTKVLQAMARDNMRTIAITSANYGDGKTTIAANLALSIALDVKQTVLLVDLDLRSPSVHEVFGLKTNVGLTDYIVDNAPVSTCIVRPSFDRLALLPITKPIENSSELLGTPKMAQLAHELKTRYPDRLVIYDMPPLLSQDDAMAFLPQVDGVILVVRDRTTKTEDIDHCLHALDGANLIGTVLNNSAEIRFNQK